ncbi:MAG: lipoyl synthase [Gammaproteobacteria bacterium]|nr:lipoyl synthase [Gammaproteobacteria bacterium]
MTNSPTDPDEVQPRAANPNKGAAKTARLPIKIIQPPQLLPKPAWIRVRAPNSPQVAQLKAILRAHQLHTVCEEAACPNIGECFNHGTATFMIMGAICTRRCPFCDVAHGRPNPLDEHEPENLALTIAAMQLKYVVVTSVDRDDLRDGGAQHFANCIRSIRRHCPTTQIEILTPDFRGRLPQALQQLQTAPPDVFNHNLETVPRLYKQARPGADYQHSLNLIKHFKQQHPQLPTKSGLMLGLGETLEEVKQVLVALRRHDCDRLTLGQYLQPSQHHLTVQRYVPPAEFAALAQFATGVGFTHVASGPLVRSSYHADLQAAGHNVG